MNDQIQTITKWLGTGSINFFGIPFAGKDTQCEKLVELFNAKLVSSGDILRSYHNQRHLDEYMATGKMIPTDLYQEIIIPYFTKAEFTGYPLILSSVGRLVAEMPVVIDASLKSGHPIKAAIILCLDEDEVWERFKISQADHDRGNRPDDNENTLKTRLDVFKNQTMEVINRYREQGLLIEVDGALSREEVTNEILNSLIVLAKAQ